MFQQPTSTMKFINARMHYDPTEYGNDWCVYSHKVNYADPNGGTTEKIMYIGYCKLNEVFHCPDARRNNMWQEHIGKHTDIVLDIIATTKNSAEAYNERARQIKIATPFCNVHGFEAGPRTGVRCNETGETWESQAACCKALGIAPSAMSNHLNNRPGHKTIYKRTFSRI